MMKCEKCGIEYPSEIDFHRGGADGPLICIQCHQASGASPEGEPEASSAEAGEESSVDATKSPGRFSKGGLAAAVFFAVFGAVAARDPDMSGMSLSYFGATIVLAIRSFLPGMTWGRGVLVTLGGWSGGMLLFMMALVDSDDFARLIGPVVMTFAFLWYGFKRGKIQWRKKQ